MWWWVPHPFTEEEEDGTMISVLVRKYGGPFKQVSLNEAYYMLVQNRAEDEYRAFFWLAKIAMFTMFDIAD